MDRIEQRIENLYTRRVVMEHGQTIRSLYNQRQSLYRQYAQLTIDSTDKNHDQVVTEIVEKLLQ